MARHGEADDGAGQSESCQKKGTQDGRGGGGNGGGNGGGDSGWISGEDLNTDGEESFGRDESVQTEDRLHHHNPQRGRPSQEPRVPPAVNESGNVVAGGGFQVWTTPSQSSLNIVDETMAVGRGGVEGGAAHLNEDDICWKPKRGTSFRNHIAFIATLLQVEGYEDDKDGGGGSLGEN